MVKNIGIRMIVCILALGGALYAQKAPSGIQEKLDAGQLTQAHQAVNQLLEKDRKNPELYYWKGYIELEMDKTQAARESFLAGIKIRGKYAFNHVGLARVLFREGKKDEAKAELELALRYDDGKTPDVRLAVASAYIEGGAYGDGKVVLYKLQSDFPKDPRAFILLGDYYWKTKANSLAIMQYEQAIQLDPTYVPAYVRLGQLMIEEQKYNEGIAKLNKAIEMDPNYADAYRYRGELYAKAQRFEQAKEDFRQYLELAQNDLKARDQYAAFLFMVDDYEGVIREYKALEEQGYTSWRMYRLMGYAYYELGQYEQAKASLERFFEEAEPYFYIADDYQYYGNTLLALKEYDKADTYFAKAIELDPDRASLYYDLARRFKDEKQYALEARYREKFMEYVDEPTSGNYLALGIAHYNAGDYEKAAEAFSESVSLAPGDANGYIWQARVSQKLDPDDESGNKVAAAEEAVKLLGQKLETEGELSKWELRQYINFCMLLTYHYYAPDEHGVGNCQAAKPYVEKITSLTEKYPDITSMEGYDFVQSLVDYCNQ
ncbi:MAG: tetratricopeptide repeat protein [Bacteroidetes bacterium]|nr:MAG: tetratricopeptide repeat protein [Bacteroidota bacterium]